MGRPQPRSKQPLESVKLKSKHPEKRFQKEIFEVEVPSKKGVDVWVERPLEFKEHSIEIGDISVPVYALTKVKLFFTRTQSGCLKFKLTLDKEDIYCAINHTKGGSMLLDSYYHIFAKVVSLKLQLMGRKAGKTERSTPGLA